VLVSFIVFWPTALTLLCAEMLHRWTSFWMFAFVFTTSLCYLWPRSASWHRVEWRGRARFATKSCKKSQQHVTIISFGFKQTRLWRYSRVFLIAYGQTRGRTDERGAHGNTAPDSCWKKQKIAAIVKQNPTLGRKKGWLRLFNISKVFFLIFETMT
jgi:hypothetical protein